MARMGVRSHHEGNYESVSSDMSSSVTRYIKQVEKVEQDIGILFLPLEFLGALSRVVSE